MIRLGSKSRASTWHGAMSLKGIKPAASDFLYCHIPKQRQLVSCGMHGRAWCILCICPKFGLKNHICQGPFLLLYLSNIAKGTWVRFLGHSVQFMLKKKRSHGEKFMCLGVWPGQYIQLHYFDIQ